MQSALSSLSERGGLMMACLLSCLSVFMEHLSAAITVHITVSLIAFPLLCPRLFSCCYDFAPSDHPLDGSLLAVSAVWPGGVRHSILVLLCRLACLALLAV